MQFNYFSCAQIAEMLNIKRRTVWNWCNSGRLKASRPGGRDYLISEADLKEFLASDNRVKKDAKAAKEAEQ